MSDLLLISEYPNVATIHVGTPPLVGMAACQSMHDVFQLTPCELAAPPSTTANVAISAPTPIPAEKDKAIDQATKRKRISHYDSDDTLVQEQKRARLEVLDPIMEAFNNGDLDQMTSLVRSNCHANVRVKMQSLPAYHGMAAILIYFGLLHEIYPDAMTKILDKRISTITSSCSPTHSVEYVFKVHGTRITTKPMLESFSQIMTSIGNKDMTHEDVISAISKHMITIPPQSCEEHECSFIAETILTFDNENKIIEWAYDILASNVH